MPFSGRGEARGVLAAVPRAGGAGSGRQPESAGSLVRHGERRLEDDIPGRGWSSPIAWGDRVFLTTVVNLGQTEPPKKGLYMGGDGRPVRPRNTNGRCFVWTCCPARCSGSARPQGTAGNADALKNSYASETPVTDGKRVYAYFGNVGVFCLDFEGRPCGRGRSRRTPCGMGWGAAASPVLHRDRLYLVDDNEEKSYLLALDTQDRQGSVARGPGRKEQLVDPYVWETAQRTEIVTPGTARSAPTTWTGSSSGGSRGCRASPSPRPMRTGDLLYVSSGFIVDKQRPLYAIRPGATGDISLPPVKTSNSAIAWSNPTAAPYNPTTLVYEGRLYVLYDRGLLALSTPERAAAVRAQNDCRRGKHFTHSPWAYNGRVFCLNEDGVTFVIRAGDKFELSAHEQAGRR